MEPEKRFRHKHPEIEAEIYYLTTEEGGRQTPVFNGYRGQFHYDGKDWGAPQEFIGKDMCKLGEMVNVCLCFFSPEVHKGRLHIGKTFKIREGARVVGTGKITRILRAEYEVWEIPEIVKKLEKEGVFSEEYDRLDDFFKKIRHHLGKIDAIKKIIIRPHKENTLSIQLKQTSHQRISLGRMVDEISHVIDHYGPAKHVLIKWVPVETGWGCHFIFWDKLYVSGIVQF